MPALGLGKDLHGGGGGVSLGHPTMAGGSLPGPAPDATHLFPVISFIHKGIALGGKLFLLLILFLRIAFTVVQGQNSGGGSA